ncbi:MAG: 2-hydroxycyclohexanecarboxyl-CoA dehydrogenase [Chloroflexota bacterium]|jgi:2-hydroxycyclohexanecarboxyl-CoA dehydrogenase|nr:2-hydroxycyclohexanecarboxyl-CoA dehydrogenase [Chloroflexota bacterium]
MAKDNGKVALVTGAGGGMGAATVKRLVEDGYKIAAFDINAASLAAAAEGHGDRVKTYTVDMTDEQKVRDAVAEVEKDHGKIDALVNTIGWTDTTRFLTEDSSYWRKVIAINFESILYVTHAVLPGMIERGGGKIVSVASDAAKVGQSAEAVYAGTKGALVAWSKSIAREVARFNINVNCTAPGPTATPLDEGLDPEVINRIVRLIPFRRRAEPREQAAVLSFLISDDASYITGQCYSVSAGLTMI